MADNEKSNVDKEELKEYTLAPEENIPAPKGAKRKIWRILGWCFVGLVAVLLLAFIFRDFIVEQSVRRVGSLVVGTKVEMASFTSSLKGSVELKGIKVANPAGYQKPYAFEIDRIYVKIDTSTLSSPEPVIETVTVTGVRIDMEQKGATKSNLTEIQGNVERFAGTQKQEKEKKQSADKKGSDVSPLIKKISLTSMALSLSSSALKTSLSLPLAPIYLNDVGGKGEPLGDSLLKIYQALMTSINAVTGTVAGSVEVIGKAGETVGTGLQKGASTLGEAGKSVGSGIQSVGKGVTDLFKKK